MPSQLEELVSFLHDDKPEVRLIALDHLVPYSKSSERTVFTESGPQPVQDLKKLAVGPRQDAAAKSLTILINLSDDESTRETLVADKLFVQSVVENLLDTTNKNADLDSMLLANLSLSKTIVELLTMTVESTFPSSNAMDSLVDVFVAETPNPNANYDYLSYVFSNVSRFDQGRQYFISDGYDGTRPLLKLVDQSTCVFGSKVRRLGVAATVKNSLFDPEQQSNLLEESGLLPYLLDPLYSIGLDAEEVDSLPVGVRPTTELETETDIISNYLESLLLLGVTRRGRDYLRDHSTYPVIREFHKLHKDDDQLGDLCFKLVDVLMRDEKNVYDPEQEKTEIKEYMAAADEESGSDSDSDDNKIVEVA